MKSFLKYTAATIVGICLTTFLFFILMIIIIGASSTDKPVELRSNTLLFMELNNRIVERAVENPLDFLPAVFPFVREMGLNDILDNIEKAENDDNIAGIYTPYLILRNQENLLWHLATIIHRSHITLLPSLIRSI